MFEIKFKVFRFRDFMDFVLNLSDRYGLGQVRFYPDRKVFFDDYQLSHISPSRDVEDQRGFAWAWSKKENEVRRVTFDQFSNDRSKKVNITIDLNKRTIKLNESLGISPVVIEDLVKKRFDYKDNLSIEKFFLSLKNTYKIKKILKKELLIPLIIAFLTAGSAPWWYSPVKTFVKETKIITYINDIKKSYFTNYNDPSRKLDISLNEIFNKMNELVTGEEKQMFIANYSGFRTNREAGEITSISLSNSLEVLVDVDIDFNKNSSKLILCSFDNKWDKKLHIVKDNAYIEFVGVVDNYDIISGKVMLLYWGRSN